MFKLVAHIRWLRPLDDGVLVICEELAQDSWALKHVTDTCMDVTEGGAGDERPAAVPEGSRWWRFSGNSASSANTGDSTTTTATAAAPSSSATDPATDAPGPTELPEPSLFGSASQLRSDAAYPSHNPAEWLTDLQLANAHAADERPQGQTPVRCNYPRPASLVPGIFSERPALRVLHERASVLIQQFCELLHWHNIVLIGPEQRAYHWEPFGASKGRRDPIFTAFASVAPPGWTLESIRVQLQADGHSCGDWAHYFRCRALAYVWRPGYKKQAMREDAPVIQSERQSMSWPRLAWAGKSWQ